MNLLDRHFLREFFKPFGACLVAFLLSMLVHDLFDNINDFIQAKTPIFDIATYYLMLIPAWFVDIMPIPLLLALLYVLSDMSKHGELTAMRACGLDFFRLMSPYFALGLVFSLGMLWLNLVWAPKARFLSKEVFEKTTRKNKDDIPSAIMQGVVYRDLAGNRYWTIDSLDILEKSAVGIEILQSDESHNDLRKISARTGIYTQGHWVFRDVFIYDYTLPMEHPSSLTIKPMYEAFDYREAPNQFVLQAKKTKRMTTEELMQSLRYASRLPPKHRAMFATEFQFRIAFPLACLVVFLIGVPFGVVGERSSSFLAIVNTLLLFFGYMLLTHVMGSLGQTGRIPAWFAAWLPNLLFAGIGLYFIRTIR